MTKKYSNPYLTLGAFDLPFEKEFQFSRWNTSEMNSYSPAIELKVFCYTQTESGALIHAKL